jgi:hypothetical protein
MSTYEEKQQTARLSDDELAVLAAWLRATAPEREAPTAHALADTLEDAIGTTVALNLTPAEKAECQVAIERAMDDGQRIPESLLVLYDDIAR